MPLTDEQHYDETVIHDVTQWEDVTSNACSFVNKSSKLREDRKKLLSRKDFSSPVGESQFKGKYRPILWRLGTATKSQLTIELIDEDYTAEKNTTRKLRGVTHGSHLCCSVLFTFEQNYFLFGTKPQQTSLSL